MDKTEQDQLVSLLGKLEPGFLPYDIFVQIARLTVLPIIEFVPLRVIDGRVEVLLLKRSANDDIWPGEIHTPGTVIRATDNSGEMYKAFERILNDEMAGTKVTDPYYVGSILHQSKRGMEQAQVFWVEVIEEPKIGIFYPAINLPETTISSQKEFIAQAVSSFTTYKNLAIN